MSRGAELFRKAPGTQAEKAKALGLAQPYVSQLCQGKRTPSDTLKGKIREAYGVPEGAWGSERGDDAAPSSGERAAHAEAPAPASKPAADRPTIREGATPREQCEATLAWLAGKQSLTTEQANLSREMRNWLVQHAKLNVPIEQHPDWGSVVEVLLDAVEALPGGPAAVLEAVRRAASGSARKAAA